MAHSKFQRSSSALSATPAPLVLQRFSSAPSAFPAPLVLGPALLASRPRHHPHREQVLVRPPEDLGEILARVAHRPAEGELDRCGTERGPLEATHHLLNALTVGIGEQHHELIAAQSHHGILGANVAHEKARHLHQGAIARLMPETIVELLEMIDVDDDAAPRLTRMRGRAPLERGEVSAVVAAGERIAQTLLYEIVRHPLPRGDVDDDAIVVDVPAASIPRGISADQRCAQRPIHTAKLELDLQRVAITIDDLEDARHLRGIGDELAHPSRLERVNRFDTEYLHERGVTVEKRSLRRGDVHAHSDVAYELAQGVGVGERRRMRARRHRCPSPFEVTGASVDSSEGVSRTGVVSSTMTSRRSSCRIIEMNARATSGSNSVPARESMYSSARSDSHASRYGLRVRRASYTSKT